MPFYASPVSLWEVAFKVALGKLELTMTPEEWFEMVKADYGISVLALSEAVMLKAAELPLHHRDPADRFIIATALIHQLPVLTGDKRFPLYGVKTLSWPMRLGRSVIINSHYFRETEQ